jgi:hypothetical protein
VEEGPARILAPPDVGEWASFELTRSFDSWLAARESITSICGRVPSSIGSAPNGSLAMEERSTACDPSGFERPTIHARLKPALTSRTACREQRQLARV